jgi:membrane protein implicated in regulation of membrane protease activity
VSDLPPPAQPYRTAALVHGLLAVAIVFVAWLSGGDIATSLAVAAGYFVVATAWTWFRFRQRQGGAAKTQAGDEREGGGGN